jgi:hypothetical protein
MCVCMYVCMYICAQSISGWPQLCGWPDAHFFDKRNWCGSVQNPSFYTVFGVSLFLNDVNFDSHVILVKFP